MCGDMEGNILTKRAGEGEHNSTKLECEGITAIAVHPGKDECVVAEGDSISLRALSSPDSLIQEGVYKSTLAFTQLQYDHTGNFL